MSFLGRFIKMPIRVYKANQMEMGVNPEGRDTWYAFVPFDLSSYRPSFSVEEPDVLSTKIILKNGDTTLIDLHPDDFEKLLQDWAV